MDGPATSLMGRSVRQGIRTAMAQTGVVGLASVGPVLLQPPTCLWFFLKAQK